ncbi:hypothetical protein OJF2_70210 [Aquisphaera giovannonii]|uniref:Glycoside hydrolase 123 catalytic domain-containing protein n=1 Tax=Aquisphaera giovannonii TaxID=406548 RepID=A0A5B9WEV9_9BACT|nr:DUF4091 domain-containing protein [Aquisphaera giovannonii]QEH38420.1 hypothetical protein OJF2_70210 [Aquisphaera giovannonii]
MRLRACGGPMIALAAVVFLDPDASRAGVPSASHRPAIRARIGKDGAEVAYWLEGSLRRVYPATTPGNASLSLTAPRAGRASFQVCVRNESIHPIGFDCAVVGADELKPRVRLVGLVPLPHFTPGTDPAELEGVEHGPGLVPDPLYPETKALLGPRETRSFWVSLMIPADARPGPRPVKVRVTPWGAADAGEMDANLNVAELVVGRRRDFPVIHWWRGEATWDYYQTGRFDERWWELTRAQLRDMWDHGSDVMPVPLLVARREPFRRPCQLLDVEETSPGTYRFDWTRTRRFLAMCREIGFREFEWSHLWIYWGAENPVRVYARKGDEFVMLWPPDIGGFSDTFLNFLDQFLPEFHAFLKAEGLLEHSYFHLSDEPGDGRHIENYRRARAILREKAPWMTGRIMDALSNIEYGRQGLTDIPIPMVNAAQAYIDAKIPHWVYYCCAPSGPWLNRFLDTPLVKVRMSGWLFHRLGAKGFLHWGFNYWHKMEREEIGDPFHDASNGSWPGIPFGDPFLIYPGEDGPIDSIRWEVFAESLQDMAVLQAAGVKPDDAILSDIRSYADFPKSEDWLRRAVDRVLLGPKAAAVP